MKMHRECHADGCTQPLISESEKVTGLCFQCGDGEYHGDDSEQTTPKWEKYIAAHS